MPDLTLPWQVIRVYHADGTTVPICSHRTERRANACAFAQDVLAMILEGTSRPRWSGDIRRNPKANT